MTMLTRMKPLLPAPKDGEDSISADLSNRIDSVVCDSSGNVTTEQEISTTASLWKGLQQQTISGIKCYIDNYEIGSEYASSGAGQFFKFSANPSTGVCKLTVRNTLTNFTREVVTIEVTGTICGATVTRKLTLVINGVRPGADGEPSEAFWAEASPKMMTCVVDSTTATWNGQVNFWKRTGSGEKEAWQCYMRRYLRRIDGSLVAQGSGVHAVSFSGSVNINIGTHDALVFFLHKTEPEEYTTGYEVMVEIPVNKYGDTGPQGNGAVEYAIEPRSTLEADANGVLVAKEVFVAIKKTTGSETSYLTTLETNMMLRMCAVGGTETSRSYWATTGSSNYDVSYNNNAQAWRFPISVVQNLYDDIVDGDAVEISRMELEVRIGGTLKASAVMPVPKNGARGDKGMRGVRERIWKSWLPAWTSGGMTFRNDDAERDSNVGYMDYRAVRDTDAANGWALYECQVTHTIAANAYSSWAAYWADHFPYKRGTTQVYWRPVDSTHFVDRILAFSGNIELLASSQITIYSTEQGHENDVWGAFRAPAQRTGWSLWLGGATGDSAAFAVDGNGDGKFEGTIKAKRIMHNAKDLTRLELESPYNNGYYRYDIVSGEASLYYVRIGDRGFAGHLNIYLPQSGNCLGEELEIFVAATATNSDGRTCSINIQTGDNFIGLASNWANLAASGFQFQLNTRMRLLAVAGGWLIVEYGQFSTIAMP